MFNRVSKISKETFVSDSSTSRGELDGESLEPILADGEGIQYVLASAAGIEHTTQNRTTTIEPGDDNAAYAVVTDRRIFFLLGAESTEPELSFDLDRIVEIDLRNALLSATLYISAPDSSVRFIPADTETAADVVEYASRIGEAWSDLFDALDDTEESLEAVRSAIEAGEDPQRAVQRTRSWLSKAHHSTVHEEGAPTELMKAEIAPLEDELEQLLLGGRLDRTEELIGDARFAADSGEFDDAVDAVVEASDVVRDVATVLDDVDAPDAEERLTSHANELDDVARDLLEEAENACHRGLGAEDPTDAISAWETALERYRTAIAAEWDGPGGATLEALRYQLAWVVGNLIDAHATRAAEREAAADDGGLDADDSAERYEAAREDLCRARDLAEEHPHATTGSFAERIDDLEEKREVSEWQWGSPD